MIACRTTFSKLYVASWTWDPNKEKEVSLTINYWPLICKTWAWTKMSLSKRWTRYQQSRGWSTGTPTIWIPGRLVRFIRHSKICIFRRLLEETSKLRRVRQEVIIKIKQSSSIRSLCLPYIRKPKRIEVLDHGKEKDRVQELEISGMNLLEESIHGQDRTHQGMILAQCSQMIDLEEMEWFLKLDHHQEIEGCHRQQEETSELWRIRDQWVLVKGAIQVWASTRIQEKDLAKNQFKVTFQQGLRWDNHLKEMKGCLAHRAEQEECHLHKW